MVEAVRPSGTLTFLFTDVEGSTRLWEQHPGGMQAALERHDQILRGSIDSHRGYVFSTAGDAFGAAFEGARSAALAALEAQRLLGVEHWPPDCSVRVRMGLHTGEAQERDGDYFGPPLNRAARIMSAAHGGQTVVSSTTRALVGEVGPLVELGEHRLRDLGGPESLWQLGAGSFPPLRTLERARHNLPVQRTELFGRDAEIAEIASLVPDRRLVTLTGVGGAGKTRLALAVAAELVDGFADGVFFASLAATSDPTAIGSVVAGAAGRTIGSTDVESVAAFLGQRDLLMVIDNCEHLIDDVADLVDAILGSGSACRVLATSREALEVEGEKTYTVPSLRTDTAASAGVRLLVDRAHAVRGDLVLDDESMSSMIEICTRLDGIPLAVELAAAQLAHLSPSELAGRLDDRFRVLVGGRRRRLQRQQTLGAMMDWSWELLDSDEQDLLTQLSVFAGGWTLEAAEGVCELSAGALVSALQRSLVAKSLVQVDGHGERTRYGMLETVRMYSQQKLLEAGATARMRERHARYFCLKANAVAINDRFLNVQDALRWERETDNTAAVVDWLRDEGRLPETAALVTMPALVWRSMAASGRYAPLIAEVLESPLEDRHRGVVLVAAAELAWQEGKIIGAMGEYAREAAAIGRRVGDDAMASAALILESITLQARQPERAEAALTEAAELGARCGDVRLEAAALAQASGYETFGRGRTAEARAFIDRARAKASTDGWERIQLETLSCAVEIVAGNWTAAESAFRAYHRAMIDSGEDLTWANSVDEAVFAAELGSPPAKPLTVTTRELRAAGGNADRPELLMIPLGAACLKADWSRAARIVASIRAAARTGLTFGSVPAAAYYVHYRSQIPPNILDDAVAEPLADVIAAELERETDAN